MTSSAELAELAAPFDAVAERYDDSFTSSHIGQAQRALVWKELEKAFPPGAHVLEIGCGTGVDACFLAECGIHVVACDSSRKMIKRAERRVSRLQGNARGSVDLRWLSAESISVLSTEDRFDGAFSNFGALNCVQNLEHLARDLAILLKPGSTALFVLMGPCCVWEVGWYLAHGNPKKAFRRFHRDGVAARLDERASLQVWYPSVRSLAHVFAPEFRLRLVKGVGVSVPPSYLEPWARRFPRLVRLGFRIDSVLGFFPGVRTLGDHMLLKLVR